MIKLTPAFSIRDSVRLLVQCFVLSLFLCANGIHAETTTSSLYSEVERSVYQIRVISKQTGKKITIGSGFIVGREDVLATNYHVVSSFVTEPDKYELDFMSTTGESGSLQLLDLDIVHDLAVLKAKRPLGEPLELAEIPEKGAVLYSLGNPLDLGFSIVTGTNNGELEQSVDHNILFSGSLNAGMSGGPALDEHGHVVGINVATSGNEISFLVAADYLGLILERLRLREFKPHDDMSSYISQQLSDSAKAYVQRLIDNKQSGLWEYSRIGQFRVPSELGKTLRCWDASEEEGETSLLINYFTQCSNERNIYIQEGISSFGLFQYQYDWYEAKDILPAHFYRIYENKNGIDLVNEDMPRDQVTSFKCHTGFVDVSGKDIKFSVCRRDYTRYEGLSDVVINGVMVGEAQRGFIFNVDMLGTDFDMAINLFELMLGELEWVQ